MPRQVWKHRCKKSGKVVQLATLVCPECGQAGTSDGWRYSMIEAMGAYQERTGLRPIGPHRKLADKLLGPLFRSCPACHGNGLLENGDHCPECRGTGDVLAVSAKEFEDARRQIFKAFPEADVKVPLSPDSEFHKSAGCTGGGSIANPFDPDQVLALFRNLTGREPTPEEIAKVHKEMEELRPQREAREKELRDEQ